MILFLLLNFKVIYSLLINFRLKVYSLTLIPFNFSLKLEFDQFFVLLFLYFNFQNYLNCVQFAIFTFLIFIFEIIFKILILLQSATNYHLYPFNFINSFFPFPFKSQALLIFIFLHYMQLWFIQFVHSSPLAILLMLPSNFSSPITLDYDSLLIGQCSLFLTFSFLNPFIDSILEI